MRTVKTASAILVIACGVAAFVYSEASSQASRYQDTKDEAETEIQGFVQPQALALESTIDPDRYYVGPSDLFAISIWISTPVSFTLSVTPEGTLIIPTVGEIRIADLTLTEAKARVREKIATKYRSGPEESTVTLIAPRPIVVWVRGNVLNPGSYEVWAFNRADKAIEEANKLRITQAQEDLQIVLESMSTRNVTVRHKDGTTSAVDISKFLATKDDRWNPHLREGDVVIVPRKDLERNVIGVYGEVNVPGRYEFVRGDSIKDAIGISQGFTSEAITDSIEFFRIDVARDTLFSVVFNGDDLLAGRIADVALEPGDRIVVRARPDTRADNRVTVRGEVMFPGVYPITRNRTYLSEVIAKAGGFTEFASVKTAEVLRRSVRREDLELERLLSVRGGAAPDDSLYFFLETDLRLRKEIVNVDFDSLFIHGDSSRDVVLQDGDLIMVPSRRTTIYVFGQVVSPGHLPFIPEADVSYYIRHAGGFTDRARPDDVRVVKAKTRQWLSLGATVVEEGDYIWVPKEIDRSFGYYMAIIGQTAAIVSVALSIVLISLQIGKQ